MIRLYTEKEYKEAGAKDLLKLKCEFCGKEFYVKKSLISYEIKHNKGKCKYCSPKCVTESNKAKVIVHCQNCGKEKEITKSVYEMSETKHFFCNQSCAASFNNKERKLTEETKEKIRNSVNNYLKNKPPRKCIVCGKEYYHFKSNHDSTKKFCSKDCEKYYQKHKKEFLSQDAIRQISEGGRKSANVQKEKRRSKNEKYFCELCENHFSKVRHNELFFNGWDADIIIDDIKVAVLWNGNWHYKKITKSHSIEQTQNRDEIKIDEIKKCGYTPYVIKDVGKYNPKFVEEKFKELLRCV